MVAAESHHRICQAILFTSKEEAPPVLRALAANLPRSYEFGFVHDADKDIMEQFSVKRVPSMILAMADPASGHVRLQPYPGADLNIVHSHPGAT